MDLVISNKDHEVTSDALLILMVRNLARDDGKKEQRQHH